MTAIRSPFDTDHRIGRLDVVASVHDLDNAMAFRPRLESLAWEKFPDVIQGVFDKFASADTIFQLDKLELDLGTVRPAFLEADAIAALENALEEALAGAIHDAKSSKPDDRHLIDTPAWRLQQFETFLCDGRPRFSVNLSSFDPTTELIWLLDNEPEAFLAMLDRREGHPHALERLSLQIGEMGREALVKQLAPSDAADTIGFMKDMEEILAVYSSAPQRTGGSFLRQKIWVETIAYLLHARGGSYDPKHLLTQIMANLAELTKIALPELISSIADVRLAKGRRSYTGLGKVLSAVKAEQDNHENATVLGDVTDIATSNIEDWRKLFNRQTSSGTEGQVRFASLTKAQFEELLKAWAPEGLLPDKSKALARSLSQADGVDVAVEDEIGEAIFGYIAAHIDDVADLAGLWKHVLSTLNPTSENPALAAAIVKTLLSHNASVEQDIAAMLDRAVEQDIAIREQRSDNMDDGDNTGQVGHESAVLDSERLSPPNKNEDGASLSRLKTDIGTALASGDDRWRQLLKKYAWTADQKRVLFDLLSQREFHSLIEQSLGDPPLAAEIVTILSSDGDSAAREIADIVDRAAGQDGDTGGQSSDDGGGRKKTGRGRPGSPTDKGERSGHAGGPSHATLRADIVKAMKNGGIQWRRLLQKHAQTADARMILSDILSLDEFEALLAAIAGDPEIPAMQRALLSAISQATGTELTAPIMAALLEYLMMRGDSSIGLKSYWQHLLVAMVPAAEYDEIRPKIVEILMSGNSKIEQELVEVLMDGLDGKSDSPSTQFKNPVPETDAPTQNGTGANSIRRINKSGLDHSDVVHKILEDPTEWRALLHIYAQNAEERARLLAAMNSTQFGLLLQAATGDPNATATLRAFLSALSLVIGTGAAARAQSAILEYLASHDSHPVDNMALWMDSLGALFPATMSTEEKSVKARKIFNLLPYDDDRLGSVLFHAFAATAGQKTGFESDPNQSGSQALTRIKNADFIASILEADDPSLLDKLRIAMPQASSLSPRPIIRFGNGDFEAIVRRLRPADVAQIFSGIKAMLDLHKIKPFIAMPRDRLAQLVRYMVIADLIWQSHKRKNAISFWEVLIERLAEFSNMPAASLTSRLQFGLLDSGSEQQDSSALQKAIANLAEQHKPADSQTKIADDRIDAGVSGDGDAADNMPDREAVASYLSHGVLQEQRDILVRAAQEEPAWLAALARKSVSSTTGAAVVAARLLFWLTPSEILEFMAPAGASALMQKAPKSGDDEKWWQEAIAALLAGKTPAAIAVQRITANSETEMTDDIQHAALIDNDDPVDNILYEDAPRLAQNRDFIPPFAGATAERISRSDREAMAAYLEKGDREHQLEILVRTAREYPAWLAELARKSVSTSTEATVVAQRLLFWLMPREILEFLAPALASALMQRAPKFNDDGTWWTETIAALLLGNVPSSAEAIEGDDSLVLHFDRLASLQHWLNGSNVPANAAEQFFRLTQAERISLLRADTVDATLQKIHYAAATLGMEKTETLLQDIIGWAQLKKGPLASLIGENKADQHKMLLRAAAANLVSTEIDLNILADPLPELVDVKPVHGPENPDASGSDKPGVSDLMAWLDGKPAKVEEMSQLRTRFDHLIDNQDGQLLNYISSHFYREEQRSRWVGLLPKASLGRVLHLIAPHDARTLHDGILLLTTAASQLLTFGSPPLDGKKLWLSMFNAVARPRKIDITVILADLAAEAAGGEEELERKIRLRAVALAGDGDHITVAAALRRTPRPEAEQNVAAPSAKPTRGQGLESFENGNMWEEEEEISDQPIYVANAGLILINPFLPALFERLDLLSRDENDKPYIDSESAASRAVHLLQYLVTGQTATPEPLLFLNKLLCGLPTGMPVASGIEPDSKDIEICNGLLEGMLENWTALHGTSVDGLRETFLQREGRLNYGDEKWSLVIQRKTLDILKDQISWNTSVIFHPWMNDPIHTTW